MQAILNASHFREVFMKYYTQHPTLYRSMFYGDWLAKRPGLHIWLIRFCGVCATLMALLFFLAVWSAAFHR
jgi:hypothetical protein